MDTFKHYYRSLKKQFKVILLKLNEKTVILTDR